MFTTGNYLLAADKWTSNVDAMFPAGGADQGQQL